LRSRSRTLDELDVLLREVLERLFGGGIRVLSDRTLTLGRRDEHAAVCIGTTVRHRARHLGVVVDMVVAFTTCAACGRGRDDGRGVGFGVGVDMVLTLFPSVEPAGLHTRRSLDCGIDVIPA
jgi:hypothetical protein